jgi:hypothetical protein
MTYHFPDACERGRYSHSTRPHTPTATHSRLLNPVFAPVRRLWPEHVSSSAASTAFQHATRRVIVDTLPTFLLVLALQQAPRHPEQPRAQGWCHHGRIRASPRRCGLCTCPGSPAHMHPYLFLLAVAADLADVRGASVCAADRHCELLPCLSFCPARRPMHSTATECVSRGCLQVVEWDEYAATRPFDFPQPASTHPCT